MAAPALGGLPDSPDPELTNAYSCEVLHTTKGLLRGDWGSFKAEAFYRPLPGGVTTVRHILIRSLEVSKYAEREGEVIAVDSLGEGSYAHVFGVAHVAAKVISDRERPWVHRAAVQEALRADRLLLGPRVFGHGTVEQSLGGHFRGTALFMERLEPLGEEWSEADTAVLLGEAAKVARVGFHNDLKLANVLRREGKPVIIDFDLWSPWIVKVAVTSGCLEHDFQEFLEPLGDPAVQNFREYYDLFAFSLTLQDGQLYRSTLQRLQALWAMLEVPVLCPLSKVLGTEKLGEVPFEVLVRVPLRGVTVNLLDLRGNLFAHLQNEGDAAPGALPAPCEQLPQRFKSNGVYWP